MARSSPSKRLPRSCQQQNPQGPIPVRLHAERKQWLISLAAHEAMCHHANTVQPQGPGSPNGLHPTRINQICTPLKASYGYCPLFSHSGMQKGTGSRIRRDLFSTFVKQTRTANVFKAVPCYPARYPYLSRHPWEYGGGLVGAFLHSRLLGEE